jgi:hypothetical protein
VALGHQRRAQDDPRRRPIKKDQIDQQTIPGEQSLASWWLRSQMTFIGGAGLLYQDPAADNQYAIRYGDSVGVNPWVNGKLTLLRETSARIADGTGNKHFVVGWNDGTDRYWSAVGNVLKSDTGSATTTITWGGANIIRSLTSDGTRYYAADNVGVWRGHRQRCGAALCATGTTNVVVRWVKGRLMLAQDNLIYEVRQRRRQDAKFTHLNPAFTFTDFAEGTNAIYAAGYAGSGRDLQVRPGHDRRRAHARLGRRAGRPAPPRGDRPRHDDVPGVLRRHRHLAAASAWGRSMTTGTSSTGRCSSPTPAA